MKLAATKIGDEPIPGYTLRKRLGAGGYGEVWLSDAPGGLQKAVKIIYGTVDQSHASSELKSLDRILQLNHPFLLSLERIEVVENQVVIITELAESSLLDRFDNYRRKGEPGIPRSLLLEFLRDTADALDFLSQKHSLQHLDVKPGNLLIVADRIKVGDFGLVKDLHDQNQSLVTGLTPTYSAPEIFDGRPDYRSDQYSLAIVYMEMLTGHLPFTGKTTAELARQHINQPPHLEALPPADRPVINRALSKNPLDRFGTCRQLIEQLQKTRSSVLPQLVAPDSNESRKPDSTSTKTSDTTDSNCPTATAAGFNFNQEFEKAIPREQLPTSWQSARSMFIGLGGLGSSALHQLRNEVQANCDGRLGVDDYGWLAIDTTAEVLNEITASEQEFPTPESKVIQLPIYKPAEYREAASTLFSPISRRWLYNIPKSLTTEGVRPLAMLSLLDHYKDIHSKLRHELTELIELHRAGDESEEPLRVYVLSSLHGGTGGALLAEIGHLVRIILKEQSFVNYRITGIASCATTTNSASTNLPAASAMCCLSELAYQMSESHELPPVFVDYRASIPSTGKPYDWVTLIDGGLHGDSEEAVSAARNMAKFALLDSQTVVHNAMAEERISSEQGGNAWLRTGCADALNLTSRINQQQLTRWCTEQALNKWAHYMNGPKKNGTTAPGQTSAPSNQDATVSGDLPLTPKASGEITRRLLTDLGVVQTTGRLQDIAGSADGNAMLAKWARRLSGKPDLIAAQMAEDVRTWKESIRCIVNMKIYNWKQVEQIQLNVIEGILDYCEQGTSNLISLFEPFTSTFGTPDQMLGMAVKYLRLYTEECVNLLGNLKREGNVLAEKLDSWAASVTAEKLMNDAASSLDISRLPTQMQVIATRVLNTLDAKLHGEALKILDQAAGGNLAADTAVKPMIPDNLTLRGILLVATESVSQMARELRIDFNHIQENTDDTSGVNLKDLDAFSPPIAQFGGKTFRFAVAPVEQQPSLKQTLEKRGMLETTTVVDGTTSLGTHMICDAGETNLPQFVASYFRPAQSTLQLAERLHVRSDVDWPPMAALLEAVSAPGMPSLPNGAFSSGNAPSHV